MCGCLLSPFYFSIHSIYSTDEMQMHFEDVRFESIAGPPPLCCNQGFSLTLYDTSMHTDPNHVRLHETNVAFRCWIQFFQITHQS